MKNLVKSNWLIFAVLLISLFLRLYKIVEIPVSLFGDELDVGYHAYSILKTGKDYYGNPWPLHFHSIAEWRTPLYLYATVPTVAMFGISPLGVRLPAVVFGVLGVWGMYLLTTEILRYKDFRVLNANQKNKIHKSHILNHQSIAILAAVLIALNPWHLQYSRGGFEVTMLLTFLNFGLYFFLRSLRTGKKLWVSIMFLTFTPWIYSTAKLFTPLFLIFLFLAWKKELLSYPKTEIFKVILVGLFIGLPISYSTIFGGGAERAEYTSVFTDPTIAPEAGVSRSRDAQMRGENTLGLSPQFSDRLFHNKVVIVGKNITDNYLKSFSSDFLFIYGDPNLRHSPKSIGQFYKVEIITLLLGLIYFAVSKTDKKIKKIILVWIILGVLPASLTRDGGNHATRLILILPPLIILISYGVINLFKISKFLTFIYFGIWILSFIFYLHNYDSHYPWDSERWWHYGFEDSIKTIKDIDKGYDKVIISMDGEPAWIFFAGWYEYNPSDWQNNFPIGNDIELPGFGKVSHIDKFYFTGIPEDVGIFGLGKIIDKKTLYLANASEIGENLVTNPQRGPGDLELVKAIAYPSGEPAYYLFTKR